MNRPAWPTYALGNGAVAALLTLASAALIYRGLTGLADQGAVIVGGVMLAVTARARTQLTRYRSWKREWDAMSGEAAKPPSKLFKRVVGVLIISIVTAYLYTYSDNAANGLALIWLAGGVAVATAYGLTRAIKRRNAARPKHNREDVLVAVCVSRPLIDTPPLQIAYQRLPEHCQRLLAEDIKRC